MSAIRSLALGLPLILLYPSSSILAGSRPRPSAKRQPVVPRAQEKIQPETDRHLAGQLAKTAKALAASKRFPSLHKLPIVLKSLTRQWQGFAELETTGLEIASEAAGGPGCIAGVLGGMTPLLAPSADDDIPHLPVWRDSAVPADHIAFIEEVLRSAEDLRNQALAKLSRKDRKSMLNWSAKMVNGFYPHFFGTDPKWLKRFGVPPKSRVVVQGKTLQIVRNDAAFCRLWNDKCDVRKMATAAGVLAALADARFLHSLDAAMAAAKGPARVPGVTGRLLYHSQTPLGMILIGGKGPNTYALTQPAALIIDLGGNDTYQGQIAAGSGAAGGNHVVIDLTGDDRYESEALGLATGRLGIGMLFDLAGDDSYKLATGSGGVGIGGVGVLYDAAGNDAYVGAKWTQGAAMCGLGLLLDAGGNDRHTSFGYAIGVGGPSGVAAVVDLAGNDSYQCGRKYPSGYNRRGIKPTDEKFQYTAYGIAVGVGKRIFSNLKRERAYSLAGGVGMVIDTAGDDRYESSNFSQGCGYWFAAGVKLDLAGNDRHIAARYGHAGGAHYGVGLFIDYAGDDGYDTTGPTYNCACAWDQSTMLFIEARGDDTYRLSRSGSTLGRGDIHSWAVCAELEGNDTYVVRGGPGRSSRNAVGVFCDLAGSDDYGRAGRIGTFTPADGKTHTSDPGGLFLDAPARRRDAGKSR